MAGDLESFIQQHKAKLAQDKNDLQPVCTVTDSNTTQLGLLICV